jgi:hypothetical protein
MQVSSIFFCAAPVRPQYPTLGSKTQNLKSHTCQQKMNGFQQAEHVDNCLLFPGLDNFFESSTDVHGFL